jgi:hypothetical protein
MRSRRGRHYARAPWHHKGGQSNSPHRDKRTSLTFGCSRCSVTCTLETIHETMASFMAHNAILAKSSTRGTSMNRKRHRFPAQAFVPEQICAQLAAQYTRGLGRGTRLIRRTIRAMLDTAAQQQ